MDIIKSAEKEVLLSWGRCTTEGLSNNLITPKVILTDKELEAKLQKNNMLISIFKESIREIKDFIGENYCFILTDFEGILLEVSGNRRIIERLKKIKIEKGSSFAEESIGSNAISMAMNLKEEMYLAGEDHYCDFMKQWNCFALPLQKEDGIIGYLDVSTVKSNFEKELIAIALLLRDQIIYNCDKYENAQELDRETGLSRKQKKMLTYLAQGLTEREIAEKMTCCESTIKYHKKKIWDLLGVSSTVESVVKAIKTGSISVKDINL
ncbi:regulatory LuxR family protein [Orenia metallireducens]|uniref:Regulatory protein, luxR family n=1 Tax=Orenia metallireducens TaxID=1413210 RepID=A0A285IJ83_9FIRM|nr:LuxR C-terminal-related transcriptional regulator [Orenia metallireducens]PRX16660.1 regulatory LuxR family protein [Orenia metallireducens]SNY48035.1 regulatory protein, luxR family [Orenia metallireducens]